MSQYNRTKGKDGEKVRSAFQDMVETLKIEYDGGEIIPFVDKILLETFDIGTITKKVKLQIVKGDIVSKNPESKAFKLFSEGKFPIEVAIALYEPGDRVRYISRILRAGIGCHRFMTKPDMTSLA